MHMRALIRIAAIASIAGFAAVASAATADDYKAALAKAEAAVKQAHALKNEWTFTARELKAAKTAADAGKFDEAVKHAEQAEALAKLSVEQANEQKKLWTDAVIR